MLEALLIGTFLGGVEVAASLPNDGGGDAAQAGRIEYANWRELRLPCAFQTEGAAPILGLKLWWTADGGNSWHCSPQEGMHKPGQAVDFTAPSDGRYGFWLQAIDAVEHASPAPGTGDEPTLTVVVDTEAPTIELLSPAERQGFLAGQVIELGWAVRDANLPEAPLAISYLLAENETPVPIDGEKTAYPATGSVRWPLPLIEGTVSFLFSARDRAGNRTEDRRGSYEVKTAFSPAGQRGVVAETLARSRVVPVFYRFSEIDPAAVGAVELHFYGADYAAGETDWQLARTDDDASSPVVFQAPRDGLFGLRVAVKAKDGASYLRPVGTRAEADVVTLIDTHDPQVEIVSVGGVSDKEVWVQAGSSVEIELVVREQNLAKNAAALEYSLDQGETWRALADNVAVEPEKPARYKWTVPLISSEHFLIRASASDRVGRTGYGLFSGKIRIRDSAALGEVDTAKLIRQGRVRLSQGTQKGVSEAVRLLKTAVGFTPASAEAHYSLAKALALSGERREALIHLRKAVELLPAEVAYRVELVENLLAEAKKAQEQALAEEARSHLNGISLDDLYVRSDFWLLREKYRAAEEALAEFDRSRAEKLEEERK